MLKFQFVIVPTFTNLHWVFRGVYKILLQWGGGGIRDFAHIEFLILQKLNISLVLKFQFVGVPKFTNLHLDLSSVHLQSG